MYMRRQEENESRKCNGSPMAAQRLCFVILLSWFSSLFIWICSEITDGFVFCNRKWGLCVCCFFLCSPPFWFLHLFLKKKSHKNNFVWPVQEKLIPNVNRSPVDFASFQPVLWFFYRFCARPVTGFIRTERGSSSRSDRLVQFDFYYTVIYIYTYVILHVDVDYVKVKLDEAIKKLA